MITPKTELTAVDRARGYNFVDRTSLGLDGNPVKRGLKGLQAKATLPEYAEWQKANPEKAVLHRYRHPYTMEQNTGYRMGTGFRNWAAGDNILSKGFSAGVLPGGLTGGAIGAGLGALLGLVGSSKSEHITPLRTALLLGALGSAYGSYRGYQNKKQASNWRRGPNAYAEVIDKLRSAPNMSFSERTRLMQGVRQLTPQQAERLSRMLGASFGAGIGAIVAKFLMGAGLGGTLVAGALGGIVGRALLGGAPENALGQRSLNHHTIFNSPIF